MNKFKKYIVFILCSSTMMANANSIPKMAIDAQDRSLGHGVVINTDEEKKDLNVSIKLIINNKEIKYRIHDESCYFRISNDDKLHYKKFIVDSILDNHNKFNRSKKIKKQLTKNLIHTIICTYPNIEVKKL